MQSGIPQNWRKRIARLYDSFNESYFGGRLPDSKDVLLKHSTKMYRASCRSGRYVNLKTGKEQLGLNFATFALKMYFEEGITEDLIINSPDEEDLGGEPIWGRMRIEGMSEEEKTAAKCKLLMIHEMVHHEQRVEGHISHAEMSCKKGHGPFFRSRMREMGYPNEAARYERKRKRRSFKYENIELAEKNGLQVGSRVQVLVDTGIREWQWNGCKDYLGARYKWREGEVVRVNKTSVTVELDEPVIATALNGNKGAGVRWSDVNRGWVDTEETTRVRVGPEKEYDFSLDRAIRREDGSTWRVKENPAEEDHKLSKMFQIS